MFFEMFLLEKLAQTTTTTVFFRLIKGCWFADLSKNRGLIRADQSWVEPHILYIYMGFNPGLIRTDQMICQYMGPLRGPIYFCEIIYSIPIGKNSMPVYDPAWDCEAVPCSWHPIGPPQKKGVSLCRSESQHPPPWHPTRLSPWERELPARDSERLREAGARRGAPRPARPAHSARSYYHHRLRRGVVASSSCPT